MSRRHGEKPGLRQSSPLKQWLPTGRLRPPRGRVTISGDISGCRSSWVKARDAVHTTAPRTGAYLVQNVNSFEVGLLMEVQTGDLEDGHKGIEYSVTHLQPGLGLLRLLQEATPGRARQHQRLPALSEAGAAIQGQVQGV